MDEIQKAHDILISVILDEVNIDQDEALKKECSIACSALCWLLKHDHNTSFVDSMKALEEKIQKRGYLLEDRGTPHSENYQEHYKNGPNDRDWAWYLRGLKEGYGQAEFATEEEFFNHCKGVRASGIVAVGVPGHETTTSTDSGAVIPEGSEKIAEAYMDRIINVLIDKWHCDRKHARDIGRDFFYSFVLPIYELGGQYGLKPVSDKPAIDDTLKGDPGELLAIVKEVLQWGNPKSDQFQWKTSLARIKEIREAVDRYEAAQPPPQAESQKQIWADVEYNYVNFIDRNLHIKDLLENFTITRKP